MLYKRIAYISFVYYVLQLFVIHYISSFFSHTYINIMHYSFQLIYSWHNFIFIIFKHSMKA